MMVVRLMVVGMSVAVSCLSEQLSITNSTTRVVLNSTGGRLTEYSLNGKNILYTDPTLGNWKWDGKGYKELDGGRCDIGPAAVVPKHYDLWLGEWTLEQTGPRSLQATSVVNDELGVQLVRDFQLSETGSELMFTQTIRNICDTPRRYSHFGRTFVAGDGVCIVPLNLNSRFPKGYVQFEGKYDNQSVLLHPADDPAIRRDGGLLFIHSPPERPKVGIDSEAGWIAFHSKRDLLFTKRFSFYPEKIYGEPTGHAVTVWYNGARCEIEPLGPWEWIEPGGATSFSEIWTLEEKTFSELNLIQP